MVDKTSLSRYSKVIVLTPKQLPAFLTKGNPFTDVLILDLSEESTLKGGNILVFDAQGRLVFTHKITSQEGHSLTLPLGSLPKGAYIVQYQSPTAWVYNQKVLKI